jgi:hypothetical protein
VEKRLCASIEWVAQRVARRLAVELLLKLPDVFDFRRAAYWIAVFVSSGLEPAFAEFAQGHAIE